MSDDVERMTMEEFAKKYGNENVGKTLYGTVRSANGGPVRPIALMVSRIDEEKKELKLKDILKPCEENKPYKIVL